MDASKSEDVDFGATDRRRGLLLAMKSIAWISAVWLVACVPPTTTSPSYFGQQQPQQQPQQYDPQAQPQQAAAGTSSCLEMFQCLAACADGTCMQACYGRGDSEAQQAASALISCGQAGGTCEPELARCRGNAVVANAPSPAPSSTLQVGASGKRQPVANDQILPWLTGSWIGNNHQFEFYGDGRVRRSNGGMMTTKRPGERGQDCVAVTNDTGTVTQQGDLLIMVFAAADGYTCGIREHDPGVTVRYRIEWVDSPYYDLNELQLRLIDIDCTAGEMWCADRVTRRK